MSFDASTEPRLSCLLSGVPYLYLPGWGCVLFLLPLTQVTWVGSQVQPVQLNPAGGNGAPRSEQRIHLASPSGTLPPHLARAAVLVSPPSLVPSGLPLALLRETTQEPLVQLIQAER